MRLAALALSLGIALAGVATKATAEWSANLAVEHFHWAESTTPGVTETGPRVGLGIAVRLLPHGNAAGDLYPCPGASESPTGAKLGDLASRGV